VDPVTGSLVSFDFNFRPSDGVKNEIISGNGISSQGPPAFMARADHDKALKRSIYNFVTGQMTQEDK